MLSFNNDVSTRIFFRAGQYTYYAGSEFPVGSSPKKYKKLWILYLMFPLAECLLYSKGLEAFHLYGYRVQESCIKLRKSNFRNDSLKFPSIFLLLGKGEILICRARIFKPFKEPRNRFPAWRIRFLHGLLKCFHKRFRKQVLNLCCTIIG